MTFTIDEFIVWLLKQIDIDDGLTPEQKERLHERIFPEKEVKDNGES